jgi:hypothetical protein
VPGTDVESVSVNAPSAPVTKLGSAPPWSTSAPSTGASPSVTTPNPTNDSGSPPAPEDALVTTASVVGDVVAATAPPAPAAPDDAAAPRARSSPDEHATSATAPRSPAGRRKRRTHER